MQLSANQPTRVTANRTGRLPEGTLAPSGDFTQTTVHPRDLGGDRASHPGGARPDRGAPADSIRLTLPAHSSYLSILRTATAGLAARLRFTLDEIEDMRIAVDEACAMLLTSLNGRGRRAPLPELVCTFTLSGDEIRVLLMTHADTPLPPQQTFAWQVLTALTDSADSLVADGEFRINLSKRRGNAS